MLRSIGQLIQFTVGGIAGFFAFQLLLEGVPSKPNPVITDSEIERSFADQPDNAGAVYFAVKEYFPEDAAIWREEIRRVLSSGQRDRQRIELQIYNVGADIRKRHAASLRFASGPDLNTVISQQASLVKPFRSQSKLCNALLMQGPMALPEKQRMRIAPQLSEARLIYRAMHAAERNPVERPQPTDAEWSKLFDLYLSKGFTADDIDLVVSPDQGNPRLCNAMLGFFDVVRGANFPGADAIKAEIAVAMVGA